MEKFKLDDRVKVLGKNISGKVVFIGEAHFSEGEWLGIILDEAKGRNNGSVDGHQYFKCPRNYGLFVRSCQLQKENVQTESESSSKKTFYPNYLTASMKNKSDQKINGKLKTKNKSLVTQIHPMNSVIEDLRNSLKQKSEEIFSLENQKKEALNKLKIMKTDMQKLCDEWKKSAKRENDLKLEIKTTRSDLIILKRKLCKTESFLQSSENKRYKLDGTVEDLREITEHAIIEKEIAEEKCEQTELVLKDEIDKCKALEIQLTNMKEEMKLQSVNGVPAVHYVKKLEKENEISKCALIRLRDLYDNLYQQFFNSKKEVEIYSKEIENLKSAERAMEDTLCKYQDETSELYEIIDSLSDADDVVFETTERNLRAEKKIANLYKVLYDMENQLEVSEEVEEALQEIRVICRDEIDCLESKIRHMQKVLEQKSIFIEEREDIINKYREVTYTLQGRNRKIVEELEAVSKDRKEAVLAAENLKLKIQREKRNTTKDLIERENMKNDLESCRNELKYWLPFMPDKFFDEDGENAAIQVKLIVSKMLKKLNLLTKCFQSSCYDIGESDELKNLALETEFLTYVYELYGCISLFIKSSDRINPELFLTLGKYHEPLEKVIQEIDSYFPLLANGDINRQYCVSNIKNMYCSLSQLLNLEFSTEDERTLIYLTSYLNMIYCNIKCLLTFCNTLESSENESPEFKSDINIVKEKATKIKVSVKSTLNIIQNDKNERICFHPTVEDILKKSWKKIQTATNGIINKYSTSITEVGSVTKDSKSKKSMSLNEIICNCVKADVDLDELREKLGNGEYFVECTPDSVFSPVYIWAQSKRRDREEMMSKLNSQVLNSDSEIIRLTKRLHKSENEIKKIKNIEKKDYSQQTDAQEYYITACSGMTNCSPIQQDMENTIKYLRHKNCELLFTSVKDKCEHLKPLKVLQKPKYHHETHNILMLQKRLNKLCVELKGILLPQIVDITKNTKSAKVIKYERYLTEKMLMRREIAEELWKITIDIKKLKTSSRSVWSYANSFIF